MEKNISHYKSKLKEKEAEIKILQHIAKTITYNWNLKNILASIVGTYIILRLIGMIMPLRVNQQEEHLGLDISEHGEEAYEESIIKI